MVKCENCGFLTMRHTQTRELLEVEEATRIIGTILSGYIGNPICFAGAFHLESERIMAQKGGLSRTDSLVAILQEQRDCDKFTQWKLGSTPREHQEMLDRQWMLEFQEERRKADKEWQSKQNWKLALIAGGFTILGAVLAWLLTLD